MRPRGSTAIFRTNTVAHASIGPWRTIEPVGKTWQPIEVNIRTHMVGASCILGEGRITLLSNPRRERHTVSLQVCRVPVKLGSDALKRYSETYKFLFLLQEGGSFGTSTYIAIWAILLACATVPVQLGNSPTWFWRRTILLTRLTRAEFCIASVGQTLWHYLLGTPSSHHRQSHLCTSSRGRNAHVVSQFPE